VNAILGIILTVAMVFGGYLLAGGSMGIITHALPFEMMIIGGAAIGAFIAANDGSTIKHTMGDLGAVFKGPKWKKSDYQDLLCLMHELLNILKQNPIDIEAHIEAPKESAIFAKYPKILKDHYAIEMLCDTIRSMIMNFDNVHQVEELLEKQLESLQEDKLHGYHALQSMADALPALGIVAAVLGVIKTMASIDKHDWRRAGWYFSRGFSRLWRGWSVRRKGETHPQGRAHFLLDDRGSAGLEPAQEPDQYLCRSRAPPCPFAGSSLL